MALGYLDFPGETHSHWHVLAHPGKSWHILACPGSPIKVPGYSGTSIDILHHPGDPGTCTCLKNTVLKEDGLSCIVGPHSSHSDHLSEKCHFGCKMSFLVKMSLLAFVGIFAPGPHIGHQMSLATQAWMFFVTRSCQIKSHNLQFLCSHILYFRKDMVYTFGT